MSLGIDQAIADYTAKLAAIDQAIADYTAKLAAIDQAIANYTRVLTLKTVNKKFLVNEKMDFGLCHYFRANTNFFLSWIDVINPPRWQYKPNYGWPVPYHKFKMMDSVRLSPRPDDMGLKPRLEFLIQNRKDLVNVLVRKF